MLTLAALVGQLAAAQTPPKLVVLSLTPGAAVEASVAETLSDAVAAEVARGGFFDTVSSRDIQTLLGLERQKQLLGCGDAATSACMTELSGALGARFVLSGTVGKLGEAWQLSLTALDTQKAQPLGRATRLAKSLDALRAMLPWAVAEVTATPSPAPPSRALPWTLVGAGAAAAAFGLVWGSVQLAQENQLAGTLAAGATRPGVLGFRDEYVARANELNTQKWVAGGTLLAGAALVTAGVLLFPRDDEGRVSLVPTGAGLALVGSFP